MAVSLMQLGPVMFGGVDGIRFFTAQWPSGISLASQTLSGRRESGQIASCAAYMALRRGVV